MDSLWRLGHHPHTDKCQAVSHSEQMVFFAGGSSSSSTEKDETENSGTKGPEEEKTERKKTKSPTRPADSADLKDWLEYEKNLNKSIKELEVKIDEAGNASILDKSEMRNLRASRLDAKNTIRRKRKDREREEAKAINASPMPADGLSHQNTVQNRVAVVRRFLKNSELLLMPEEREKGEAGIFTNWELAILDLHDVDQEMHMLYRGRKLYVGNEKKDAELQKKADLICRLEEDLKADRKIFEVNKKHYTEAEIKEKKLQFIEREQRIEGLRRKKEQEMYIQINQYIDELEEKRNAKKLDVINKMLTEFDTRLNNLIATWQDPPEEYKHNQKESLKQLANMKDLLKKLSPLLKIKNKFLRHKRLIEECKINDYFDDDLKSLRAFDMQLDDCELRSNAKARQIEDKVISEEAPPVEDLEQAFENWAKRYEKVQEDIVFIDGNKEEVVSSIESVKTMVEAAPLEDFTGDPDFPDQKIADKKERLKTLDQNLERVKNGDISDENFRHGYGAAGKNIRALIEDIKKADPQSPETIEKKRTLREAMLTSDKYFDEISRYRRELSEMKDRLKDYSENKQKRDQILAESEAIDVSVRWLTGTDLLRIWEKFGEWSKRRWDRKSDDRIGAVGSKMFDIPGLSITKSLANEFDKIKESSEIAEVNQYKDALANKDAWQMEDVMFNTKNKDEFKACLLQLADIGRLRFDNPLLWKQFEFFQSTIKFCDNYNDPNKVMWLQDHPMELHDRLHKAVGYCWDFDTYYTLKNSQDNSYDSKKSSMTKRCAQISEVDGGLDKRAREILTQYKNDIRMGRTPRVNPHEFEAIIEYAIEQGKMSPEGKLYYLIQGIDCGLLEYPDRLVFFNSKLNLFPALEAISSETARGKRPTRADISNWARFDKENNSPGDDFVQWYWTLVSHKPKVLQRVDSTLSRGANRMDHDDVVGAVAFGDANTVKNMLTKSSGGEYGLPQTGFMNVPVGYLKYLDNWALNAKYIDNAVIQLKRFAASFSLFYSVTQEDKRMYKNKDFYRYSEHLRNDPNGPRQKGAYLTQQNRGIKTVNDYLERTKALLSQLDKPLFDKIFDPEISQDPEKFKRTISWMKQYTQKSDLFGAHDPKKYEELIEQGLPKILEAILSGTQGKERVRNMVAAVKGDIKSTVGDAGLHNFDDVVNENHFDEPLMHQLAGKNLDNLPGGL